MMIAMMLIRAMCGRRLLFVFFVIVVLIGIGLIVVVAVRVCLGRAAAIARRVVLRHVKKTMNARKKRR